VEDEAIIVDGDGSGGVEASGRGEEGVHSHRESLRLPYSEHGGRH